MKNKTRSSNTVLQAHNAISRFALRRDFPLLIAVSRLVNAQTSMWVLVPKLPVSRLIGTCSEFLSLCRTFPRPFVYSLHPTLADKHPRAPR
jgi:hypothetical protein